MRLDRAQQQPRRVGLRRLPAVETVAVMRDERDEIGFAGRDIEPHRRRKAPEQGRHRAARHIAKGDAPPRGRELDHAARQFGRARAVLIPGAQFDIALARDDETERDRNDEGLFFVLAGRRFAGLLRNRG